jgi:predicted CXXCH cytochrome family protein
MQLQIDTPVCQDCHTTTYHNWRETAHASADVQCSSCHVPHSQQNRLVGEELCLSCHREVVDNSAHRSADVHCVDCHLPSPSAPDTATDIRVISGGTAPNHSFDPISVACAECHRQSIHQEVFYRAADQLDSVQVVTLNERVRDLAGQLEDVKRTNRSLRAISVVSLGFGLGIGGVLGIIFVLVAGYASQGRAKR